MTHHAFHEAKMQFDAARREQAELAAQALELKIAQRDALKAVAEIKAALSQLEAAKAAPVPAKPEPAAPKPTPKPKASPQSIAIGDLEQRLAVIAGKVASLSKSQP